MLESDEIEVWATVEGLEKGSDQLHPILRAAHVEITSSDEAVPVACEKSKSLARSATGIADLEDAVVEATPMDIARYVDDCRGAVVQFVGEIDSVDYEKNELEVDTSSVAGSWSSDNYRVKTHDDVVYLEGDRVSVLAKVDGDHVHYGLLDLSRYR